MTTQPIQDADRAVEAAAMDEALWALSQSQSEDERPLWQRALEAVGSLPTPVGTPFSPGQSLAETGEDVLRGIDLADRFVFRPAEAAAATGVQALATTPQTDPIRRAIALGPALVAEGHRGPGLFNFGQAIEGGQRVLFEPRPTPNPIQGIRSALSTASTPDGLNFDAAVDAYTDELETTPGLLPASLLPLDVVAPWHYGVPTAARLAGRGAAAAADPLLRTSSPRGQWIGERLGAFATYTGQSGIPIRGRGFEPTPGGGSPLPSDFVPRRQREAFERIQQERGGGGGGGYAGFSLSNRAVRAYSQGEKPLSKFTAKDLRDAGITVSLREARALARSGEWRRSSWHHTGKRYRETDFYDLDDLHELLGTERALPRLDVGQMLAGHESQYAEYVRLSDEVDQYGVQWTPGIGLSYQEWQAQIDQAAAALRELRSQLPFPVSDQAAISGEGLSLDMLRDWFPGGAAPERPTPRRSRAYDPINAIRRVQERGGQLSRTAQRALQDPAELAVQTLEYRLRPQVLADITDDEFVERFTAIEREIAELTPRAERVTKPFEDIDDLELLRREWKVLRKRSDLTVEEIEEQIDQLGDLDADNILEYRLANPKRGEPKDISDLSDSQYERRIDVIQRQLDDLQTELDERLVEVGGEPPTATSVEPDLFDADNPPQTEATKIRRIHSHLVEVLMGRREETHTADQLAEMRRIVETADEDTIIRGLGARQKDVKLFRERMLEDLEKATQRQSVPTPEGRDLLGEVDSYIQTQPKKMSRLVAEVKQNPEQFLAGLSADSLRTLSRQIETSYVLDDAILDQLPQKSIDRLMDRNTEYRVESKEWYDRVERHADRLGGDLAELTDFLKARAAALEAEAAARTPPKPVEEAEQSRLSDVAPTPAEPKPKPVKPTTKAAQKKANEAARKVIFDAQVKRATPNELTADKRTSVQLLDSAKYLREVRAETPDAELVRQLGEEIAYLENRAQVEAHATPPPGLPGRARVELPPGERTPVPDDAPSFGQLLSKRTREEGRAKPTVHSVKQKMVDAYGPILRLYADAGYREAIDLLPRLDDELEVADQYTLLKFLDDHIDQTHDLLDLTTKKDRDALEALRVQRDHLAQQISAEETVNRPLRAAVARHQAAARAYEEADAAMSRRIGESTGRGDVITPEDINRLARLLRNMVDAGAEARRIELGKPYTHLERPTNAMMRYFDRPLARVVGLEEEADIVGRFGTDMGQFIYGYEARYQRALTLRKAILNADAQLERLATEVDEPATRQSIRANTESKADAEHELSTLSENLPQVVDGENLTWDFVETYIKRVERLKPAGLDRWGIDEAMSEAHKAIERADQAAGFRDLARHYFSREESDLGRWAARMAREAQFANDLKEIQAYADFDRLVKADDAIYTRVIQALSDPPLNLDLVPDDIRVFVARGTKQGRQGLIPSRDGNKLLTDFLDTEERLQLSREFGEEFIGLTLDQDIPRETPTEFSGVFGKTVAENEAKIVELRNEIADLIALMRKWHEIRSIYEGPFIALSNQVRQSLYDIKMIEARIKQLKRPRKTVKSLTADRRDLELTKYIEEEIQRSYDHPDIKQRIRALENQIRAIDEQIAKLRRRRKPDPDDEESVSPHAVSPQTWETHLRELDTIARAYDNEADYLIQQAEGIYEDSPTIVAIRAQAEETRRAAMRVRSRYLKRGVDLETRGLGGAHYALKGVSARDEGMRLFEEAEERARLFEERTETTRRLEEVSKGPPVAPNLLTRIVTGIFGQRYPITKLQSRVREAWTEQGYDTPIPPEFDDLDGTTTEWLGIDTATQAQWRRYAEDIKNYLGKDPLMDEAFTQYTRAMHGHTLADAFRHYHPSKETTELPKFSSLGTPDELAKVADDVKQYVLAQRGQAALDALLKAHSIYVESWREARKIMLETGQIDEGLHDHLNEIYPYFSPQRMAQDAFMATRSGSSLAEDLSMPVERTRPGVRGAGARQAREVAPDMSRLHFEDWSNVNELHPLQVWEAAWVDTVRGAYYNQLVRTAALSAELAGEAFDARSTIEGLRTVYFRTNGKQRALKVRPEVAEALEGLRGQPAFAGKAALQLVNHVFKTFITVADPVYNLTIASMVDALAVFLRMPGALLHYPKGFRASWRRHITGGRDSLSEMWEGRGGAPLGGRSDRLFTNTNSFTARRQIKAQQREALLKRTRESNNALYRLLVPPANEVFNRAVDAGHWVLDLRGVRTIAKLAGKLVALGHVLEDTPRIAIFSRALSKGMSARDAHTLSRRALADWGDVGSWTQNLELIAPYTKAFVAGAPNWFARSAGFVSDSTADPRGFWLRVAGLAAAVTAIYAWNNRYEEWHDMPFDERAGGISIMTPFKTVNNQGVEKHKMLTVIPNAREMSLVTATMIYLLDTMQEEQPSEFADLMSLFGQQVSPHGRFTGQTGVPVTPALSGTIEVIQNRNNFFGRPVVPEEQIHKPHHEQYIPGVTSVISRKVAPRMGISPIQLDHLLREFTGNIGRELQKSVDYHLERMGVGRPSPEVLQHVQQLSRFEGMPADQFQLARAAYFAQRIPFEQHDAVRDYELRLERAPIYGVPFVKEIGERVLDPHPRSGNLRDITARRLGREIGIDPAQSAAVAKSIFEALDSPALHRAQILRDEEFHRTGNGTVWREAYAQDAVMIRGVIAQLSEQYPAAQQVRTAQFADPATSLPRDVALQYAQDIIQVGEHLDPLSQAKLDAAAWRSFSPTEPGSAVFDWREIRARDAFFDALPIERQHQLLLWLSRNMSEVEKEHLYDNRILAAYNSIPHTIIREEFGGDAVLFDDYYEYLRVPANEQAGVRRANPKLRRLLTGVDGARLRMRLHNPAVDAALVKWRDYTPVSELSFGGSIPQLTLPERRGFGLRRLSRRFGFR